MASQVTYSKLFSESRANIVALVDDTSNVADPNATSSEHRKFVYSREPDIKAIDFAGFPYMIVHPTDVDIGEGGSLDGKIKPVEWFIECEIVTSDRGYGKKDGQGLTNMDAISDDVMETLNNMTNRTTLSDNSMKFSRPETTAVTTDVLQNELVYRRSIMLPFKSRIAVSS